MAKMLRNSNTMVLKDVKAGGGCRDKLLLPKKCSQWHASLIASDIQSPTPGLHVWLSFLSPAELFQPTRRRGEGESLAPQNQLLVGWWSS